MTKWQLIKFWMAGVQLPEPPPPPKPRLVCGVKDCPDGVIVDAGPPVTTVECETHNARTTWDTEEREKKTQQIIRVQDNWRQHGTRPPPKR